jgi:hypothetical protein
MMTGRSPQSTEGQPEGSCCDPDGPYPCAGHAAKRRALAQLDAIERLLPSLLAVFFHPDQAVRLAVAQDLLGGSPEHAGEHHDTTGWAKGP